MYAVTLEVKLSRGTKEGNDRVERWKKEEAVGFGEKLPHTPHMYLYVLICTCRSTASDYSCVLFSSRLVLVACSEHRPCLHEVWHGHSIVSFIPSAGLVF